MRVSLTLWIMLLAALAAGCVKHTHPVGPGLQLTDAERNFQALWQAGRGVLGKHNFTLDRQDHRAGVITTLPLTGKHFFEFWRTDAATNFDLAEGTIQTIYRVVRITIRPAEANQGAYKPLVEVMVFRSNRPTPQVTCTSEAYDLFVTPGGERAGSDFLLDYERTVQTPEQRAAALTVYLGRDGELEKKLTGDILSAAGN